MPIQIGADEDQMMAWALFPDGNLHVYRLDTGELLQKRKLFDGPPLKAASFPPGGADAPAVFGFADGSIRTGVFHFTSRFLKADEQTAELRDLEPGQAARYQDTMGVRLAEGRFRLTELDVDIKEPAKGHKSPVLLVDHSKTTTGQLMPLLSADGKLRLNTVRSQTSFVTGLSTFKLSGIDLPYVEPAGKGPPAYLFLSAVGGPVLLFWKDGHLIGLGAPERAHSAGPDQCHIF